MAKDDAGRVLTKEEEREYVSLLNQRLPIPEEYDGVVFDNTQITGAVYRFQTAEEKAAGEAAAQAAKDASDALLATERAARQAAGVPETSGVPNIPNRVPVEAEGGAGAPGAPGGAADNETRQTPKGTKAP